MKFVSALMVAIAASTVAVGTSATVADAASPCKGVGTLVKPNGKPLGNSEKKNPGKVYADRKGQQGDDQERQVGATANLGGYTATVTNVEFVPSLSSFEDGGYLKVSVRLCNRDSSEQDWYAFDWKLQTPSGNTTDIDLVSAPTLDFGGGSLIQDGRVEGDIYFEVGDPPPPGNYYVVFKPSADPFDEDRGIWGYAAS